METRVQRKNRLLNVVRHSILTKLSKGTEVYFRTDSGHQYFAQYDGYYWFYRSNRDTARVLARRSPATPFAFYRMLQEPCVLSITIVSSGLVIDINTDER